MAQQALETVPPLAIWKRWRPAVVTGAITLCGVVAAIWLSYELWRLVLQPWPRGAVDLRLRLLEVHTWFAGQNVYAQLSNAVYPPASYLMLWPLLGWLEEGGARILWAVVTVASLVALARGAGSWGGATTRRERVFLGAALLATYPVGASMGNGQVGILVVLALLVALPRLAEAHRTWAGDVGIAVLVLAALLKPTIAAPFFWIVLFVPGGLRPALLTVAGYAGLTWAASLFVRPGPVKLLTMWFERGRAGAIWGATLGEGSIRTGVEELPAEFADAVGQATDAGLRIASINLHSLLGYWGHAGLATTGSAALVLLLGAWIWWHRRSSPWLLMGVAALVSRFCTYHGWYDDVLLLVPLLVLFRLAKEGSIRAGVLFAFTLGFLLAPGGLYLLPRPLSNLYVVVQALVLFLGFLLLVGAARRSRV